MPYQQKYFETIENYKSKNRQKLLNPSEKNTVKTNLIQIQQFFFESLENQLKKTESEIMPENLPKNITVILVCNKMRFEISVDNNKAKFFERINEGALHCGDAIKEIDVNSLSILKVEFFHKEELELLLNLYNEIGKEDIFKEELLKIQGSEVLVLPNGEENLDWKTVEHGDVILIFGDFKFANDFPPECITFNFKENALWDYFSCEECNLKCRFLLNTKIIFL